MTMLFHIFLTTVIPILIMVLIGFFIDRKFKMDLATLSKLNFYVVGPAFLFTNLYDSKFTADSWHILWINIFILIGTYMFSIPLIKGFKFAPDKGEALRNALLFNNCGNIGIPLIVFIYTNAPFVDASGTPLYLQAAMAVQIVLFTLQNMTTTSFGFYFAGRGRLTARDALRLVFHMPLIYAAAVGLALNLADIQIRDLFFYPAIDYTSSALIMIALFTLGVQLSRTSFNFFTRDVAIGVIGRLVGGPVVAMICIWLYAIFIQPFDAVANQVLLLSAGVPSGVNTALIAAEMRNQPEYATQLVMASTIASSLTLPLVIWLAYLVYPTM